MITSVQLVQESMALQKCGLFKSWCLQDWQKVYISIVYTMAANMFLLCLFDGAAIIAQGVFVSISSTFFAASFSWFSSLHS